MDLALNNLQRLICHKTPTTDQPSWYLYEQWEVYLAVPNTNAKFLQIEKGYLQRKCFADDLTIEMLWKSERGC